MPFIGQNPSVGAYNILDDITIGSNTNGPFNLLLNGAAFSPESANHLLVSLNGVIQKPGSSFTVSGSQITFVTSSGTLTTSDSIDFIMALGNVLDVGTPTDGSISTNKIASNAVTGAKIAPTITTNHTFSGTLEVPAATSGWRHIKTLEGSNVSSIDFLHGSNGVVFDNTYDVYEFVVHYMYTAGSHELRVEPSQDGSTFTTTNTVGYALGGYRSDGTGYAANLHHTQANGAGFYRQTISSGDSANDISAGQIRIYSAYDSNKSTLAVTTFGSMQDSSNNIYGIGINYGGLKTAGRTYGVRFRAESSNIYAKISLYGLKDA